MPVVFIAHDQTNPTDLSPYHPTDAAHIKYGMVYGKKRHYMM